MENASETSASSREVESQSSGDEIINGGNLTIHSDTHPAIPIAKHGSAPESDVEEVEHVDLDLVAANVLSLNSLDLERFVETLLDTSEPTMDSTEKNDSMRNLDAFSPVKSAKMKDLEKSTKSTMPSDFHPKRQLNVPSTTTTKAACVNLNIDPTTLDSREDPMKSKQKSESSILMRSRFAKNDDVVSVDKLPLPNIERRASKRDQVRQWAHVICKCRRNSTYILALKQAHSFIYGNEFDKSWK